VHYNSAMTSKKLIVGNWKLNPTFLREARDLSTKIKRAVTAEKKVQVVLCPPSPYLGALALGRNTKQPAWGAQDLDAEWDGAYTGGVSAPMLASSGATYVIVGHSERRAAGDTDTVINRKLKLALRAGLLPILCVGERERDDHGAYLTVVQTQLEGALEGLSKPQLKKLVIAYEPVWAIGKNASGTDTPEGFNHNAIFVKKILSSRKGVTGVPILYGGSVNIKNAQAFLGEGQADGLLIGRESLNAQNFITIVKQAVR
jgi:triosephosphate isomerase (TIM)